MNEPNEIRVGMHEAKTRLSELVRMALEENADIIITQRKKPVMRLIPYADPENGQNKDSFNQMVPGVTEITNKAPITPMDILKGSVISYDDPANPVAEDDWEAGN